jgi:hypothetical protein
MKRTFKQPESGLLVGVPYTWARGAFWYVQLYTGIIVNLNTFEQLTSDLSEQHRKDAKNYQGFQYAKSMEIL